MGLLTPTVPRDLYDALQARYDDLLNKYHALRPTHSPVAPMKLIQPKPEGEAQVRAMEQAVLDPRVIEQAEAIAQRDNVPMPLALAEAQRLSRIARGRETAPSVAEPYSPPVR